MAEHSTPAHGLNQFPRADTPEISRRLYRTATAGPPVGGAANAEAANADAFLESLASKLAARVGGGDGSGMPPRKLLGLDGGAWTKVLMGVLAASTMTVGTWVLFVRDTLKEHSAKIEHQAKAGRDIESLAPRVGALENAMQSFSESLSSVADGVEALKKENVDKLTDELREIRAENRRLQR